MVDILISGPEGKIEAKYHHNNDKTSPMALILHPDPSRGGTMNTKIVLHLYNIFGKFLKQLKYFLKTFMDLGY